MDEAKRLALGARGYDIAFEYNGNTIAINSKKFTKEKQQSLEGQFGLSTYEEDGDFIFYDSNEWHAEALGLRFKCNTIKPKNLYNLKYAEGLFSHEGISELDLSSWDVSQLTSLRQMFFGCSNLEQLIVRGWNVSKVCDISHLFYKCKRIKELDLSDWDTSNVKRTRGAFKGCDNLQRVKLGVNSANLREVILADRPECEVIMKQEINVF